MYCPLFKCPKGPTTLLFEESEQNVLVGDRGGNVRKYSIENSCKKILFKNLKYFFLGNEGVELLGHVSMILDFCLSFDEKLILTTDRDEKLRISRYPQTFVIENFCLKHTSFIKSVVCLSSNIIATSGKKLSF